MGTPVEMFIRQAHKQYNVKYALTTDQLRRIRTKLRLAEINTEVTEADVPLALDIILADYGMASTTLRTASSTSPMSKVANPQIRSAGGCPRCSHGMQFVRLADSDEARYCNNCHVCVQV
jgi:hypothetical protein